MIRPTPPIQCRTVSDYLPILIFALLAAALPLATILIARALQSRKPNPAKLEPYECGIEATTFALDTRFAAVNTDGCTRYRCAGRIRHRTVNGGKAHFRLRPSGNGN